MSTDITRTSEASAQMAVTLQAMATAQTKQRSMDEPAAKPTPAEKTTSGFDPKELQRNLREAIDSLNEQMKRNGRQLNFSIDKVVDRTVIQVKNAETGELVRQIPDETVLRVAHNIEKVKGLLLDSTL